LNKLRRGSLSESRFCLSWESLVIRCCSAF